MTRGEGGRVVYWVVVALLGIPALVLTGCRLLEDVVNWGPVVRAVSFTALAIPLYTVLVIVLLLGSLLRRHGARSRRLAGTLVALAGLGLHLWWFSPLILGSNAKPAPGARTITVMNANLYEGRADAGELVAAVRREHVDILVTEEITPPEVERLQRAGLSRLLPDMAGRADPAVSGTMVFAAQPLTDVTDLHTHFQSYSMKVGGLTLIAAHPIAPLDPGGWRSDHRIVLAAAKRDHADLVVGDLNATPDHVVMHDLEDAGFHDVATLANEGWQPTWPSNHIGVPPFLPPVIQIDHVLVGSDMAGLDTHTVHIDGTDHRSLVAHVALR